MKSVVVPWISANVFVLIAGNLQVVSAAWGTLLPADKTLDCVGLFP